MYLFICSASKELNWTQLPGLRLPLAEVDYNNLLLAHSLYPTKPMDGCGFHFTIPGALWAKSVQFICSSEEQYNSPFKIHVFAALPFSLSAVAHNSEIPLD